MTPQQHAFPRTDRTRMGVWWWTTDHLLLGATAILIVLGVLLSFASSPAAAARMNIGDPFHFAVRQCVFAVGGAAILLAVSMMSPRGIKRSAFFIYCVAIAIMIALPLLGHHAKGATRWLEFGGFSLQPSEFMKPALIVLASWMFAEGQKGEGVPGRVDRLRALCAGRGAAAGAAGRRPDGADHHRLRRGLLHGRGAVELDHGPGRHGAAGGRVALFRLRPRGQPGEQVPLATRDHRHRTRSTAPRRPSPPAACSAAAPAKG